MSLRLDIAVFGESVSLSIVEEEEFPIVEEEEFPIVEEEEYKLLGDPTVVQWIKGDLSFLPSLKKESEDKWGRAIMNRIRPDLVNHSHWTSKLGEELAKEFYTRLGYSVTTAKKNLCYLPDLDAGEFIIEVKTSTYLTSGTANEKILGCPFKYAEVPRLYGKPLIIFCIGGAERDCREKFGNLGTTSSPEKLFLLDCYRQLHIEFKAATELL